MGRGASAAVPAGAPVLASRGAAARAGAAAAGAANKENAAAMRAAEATGSAAKPARSAGRLRGYHHYSHSQQAHAAQAAGALDAGASRATRNAAASATVATGSSQDIATGQRDHQERQEQVSQNQHQQQQKQKLLKHPNMRSTRDGGAVATSSGTASASGSGVRRGTADNNTRPPAATTSRSMGHAKAQSHAQLPSAEAEESQPALPGTAAAEWERVMDAKLAQWRFMNLVAVAELQAEERAACGVLDALADELEGAMDDVAALTTRLDAVRAASAGCTFAERALPPLAALSASLEEVAPDHRKVCQGLVRSLQELRLRNVVVDPSSASALAREIARFRVAAVHFSAAARKHGAQENCAVAFEDLARVVSDEAPGVRQELCRSVKDVVESVDSNMAYRAGDLSRRRRAKRSSTGSMTNAASGNTRPRSRRVLSSPGASLARSSVASFSPKFAIGQAT